VRERRGRGSPALWIGVGSVAIKVGFKGRALAALAMIVLITAPAVPQARRQLSALAQLEPGLWQVREFGSPRGAARSLCVADPGMLMQIQHGSAPCSRLVISDQAKGATVHYTCPANGFGRTSVRVETPRLAKIDTQGIFDNAPFAWRAEARRVGPCPENRSVRR
jgi:hypothetical protein